jgi:hypothetical protein
MQAGRYEREAMCPIHKEDLERMSEVKGEKIESR